MSELDAETKAVLRAMVDELDGLSDEELTAKINDAVRTAPPELLAILVCGAVNRTMRQHIDGRGALKDETSHKYECERPVGHEGKHEAEGVTWEWRP